jgi:hypothetical protein
VEDNFGVGGRGEDGPFAFEFLAVVGGEREVAVVADGDLSVLAGDEEGLGLADGDLAGRRVARVADGGRAGQTVETLLVEDLGDEPHGALGAEHAAVGGDDAARLLPAVLELVEAEVGEARRLRVPVDAEHAALVSETVPQLFAHSARLFVNRLQPSVPTL